MSSDFATRLYRLTLNLSNEPTRKETPGTFYFGFAPLLWTRHIPGAPAQFRRKAAMTESLLSTVNVWSSRRRSSLDVRLSIGAFASEASVTSAGGAFSNAVTVHRPEEIIHEGANPDTSIGAFAQDV